MSSIHVPLFIDYGILESSRHNGELTLLNIKFSGSAWPMKIGYTGACWKTLLFSQLDLTVEFKNSTTDTQGRRALRRHPHVIIAGVILMAGECSLGLKTPTLLVPLRPSSFCVKDAASCVCDAVFLSCGRGFITCRHTDCLLVSLTDEHLSTAGSPSFREKNPRVECFIQTLCISSRTQLPPPQPATPSQTTYSNPWRGVRLHRIWKIQLELIK